MTRNGPESVDGSGLFSNVLSHSVRLARAKVLEGVVALRSMCRGYWAGSVRIACCVRFCHAVLAVKDEGASKSGRRCPFVL